MRRPCISYWPETNSSTLCLTGSYYIPKAMLNLYYKIWADAILFEKSKRGKDVNWKTITLIAISILQGLNLLVILFLLRWFSHRQIPVLIPVHIFNMSALNSACAIILVFFIPFVIFNYLLIYNNNQYLDLVKKYPDHKGKLYRNYFLFSLGVIIVPVIFKLVFITIV